MKIRLVPSFILLLIYGEFSLISSLYAWSPFHKTLPIQGKVTDAITGKSIENVMVTAVWRKMKFGLVDGQGGVSAAERSVTDKNGMFYIPSKTTFHFLPIPTLGSKFDGISISAVHPLYKNREWLSIYKMDEDGEWVYRTLNDNRDAFINLEKKNGKIQFNIHLLSLKDKYERRLKDMTSEDILLYHRYRNLKSKFVGRYVDNLTKEEIEKIENQYNQFKKLNITIVELSDLIFQFQGVVSGSLEGIAWTFNSGKKPVDLDWDNVFEKYDRFIDLLNRIEKDRIYNMIAKNYKNARNAYQIYQERLHGNEK